MLRLRLASSYTFHPPRHCIRKLSIPPVRNEGSDHLTSLLGINPTPAEQTQDNDIPATPPTSEEYLPAKSTNSKVMQHHSLPPGAEQRFQLYVKASPNNTIITFSTPTGRVLSAVSAGMCGFKKVQRSTYEAGYQCAVHIFEKIAQVRENNNTMTLQVNFKGFGQGREAVYRALTTSEGDKIREIVKCLSDRTPIKIGGTKAKKTRRL